MRSSFFSAAIPIFGVLLSNVLLAESPRHRFIAADSSKKTVAIIGEDGSTEWEMKIGPLHDLHWLDSGNILLQKSWTHVVEVDPNRARLFGNTMPARRTAIAIEKSKSMPFNDWRTNAP